MGRFEKSIEYYANLSVATIDVDDAIQWGGKKNSAGEAM